MIRSVSILLLFLTMLVPIQQGAAAQESSNSPSPGKQQLENSMLKVVVERDPGTITVYDKRCKRVWRQAATTGKPPLFELASAGKAGPRSIQFDAVFGLTNPVLRGSPAGPYANRVTVTLTLPVGAADLQVTGDMTAGERDRHREGFFFLEPFVLDTPDAVMAVADYCDGHIYPLTNPNVPMPRTYFDAGRLDLPFVGITDLRLGYGYEMILETSDDAVIECRQRTAIGGTKKAFAPHIGWTPSTNSFRYPRSLLYRFTASGGYVALAKGYRAYAKAHGLLVPFSEKVKTNPNIRRLFGAPDVWGDMSLGFAQQAKAAGIDKMLIHGRTAPQDMRAISNLGYLTSEYDNYTDILPIEKGKQADSNHDLIPQSVVMGADGKRMTAWLTYDKKLQYMKRCPELWAPTAKLVIPELLKSYPYQGRFIDVTTAEGLYECYDPNHPLTKSDKRRAGESLLAAVRANHLVVGGEHGIWWGAPYQDYIEGMMSGNRFAWPAGHLIHPKSRTEKFDGPYGTESWETYDTWSLGHQYRVPLWELVFHDCVVSTWYWGDSNDYLIDASPETAAKKEAFNILYGTMPMLWADSGGAWAKDRALFLRTYRDVCKLHELVAPCEMTDHWMVTPDGAVQETRFSNGTTCLVNFGKKPYSFIGDLHGCIGRGVVLPQNGWIVQGPHFQMSREITDPPSYDNRIDTKVVMPGFYSRETEKTLVTLRSAGPGRALATFKGIEGNLLVWEGTILKNWDSKTTRAFVLDANGERVREIDAFIGKETFLINPTGAANVELICGDLTKLPDLQVSKSDIVLSARSPIRQGTSVKATVKVHNLGREPAFGAKVSLYTDFIRPHNLLGSAIVNIAAGSTKVVQVTLDTTYLDGKRTLIADVSLTGKELCSRNNRVSLPIEVTPVSSSWSRSISLAIPAKDYDRNDPVIEMSFPNAVFDPLSVRVVVPGDGDGKESFIPCQVGRFNPATSWTVMFRLQGTLPAGKTSQVKLLYAPQQRGSKYQMQGGSRWDGDKGIYTGTTYSVQLENGTLKHVVVGGKEVISQLMTSSAASGWTDEPGVVKQYAVLEDGPIRTSILVKKQLQGGVSFEKNFVFYSDRIDISGTMSGTYGVFSRAYYLQTGAYMDSGGFHAIIDGAGDAEGVSGMAKSPHWYSVAGDGWAHTCVARSEVSDITYWDAGSNWGGIGYNAAPGARMEMTYLFHLTDGKLKAGTGTTTLGERDSKQYGP